VWLFSLTVKFIGFFWIILLVIQIYVSTYWLYILKIGYLVKKDFPLDGFVEVKYSEFIKWFSYLSLKSIQEFKIFELVNLWCKFTKFKFSDLFDLYKICRNFLLHLIIIIYNNIYINFKLLIWFVFVCFSFKFFFSFTI
jgi:hypothetical protein